MWDGTSTSPESPLPWDYGKKVCISFRSASDVNDGSDDAERTGWRPIDSDMTRKSGGCVLLWIL
jgi:hypothetical protein